MFQSKRDLSGRDCLFLAQHAFAEHYYDTALQWAQGALDAFDKKGERFGSDVHQFRKEVYDFIEHASRVVLFKLNFIQSIPFKKIIIIKIIKL